MRSFFIIIFAAIIIAMVYVNVAKQKNILKTKTTKTLSPANPSQKPITPATTQKPSLVKITQIIYPDQSFDSNTKWGTTEKIAEHTYRTYVGPDQQMGTAAQIFDALNLYRQKHGVASLAEHTDLCRIADLRIDELKKLGNLDAHAGFNKYLSNPDNYANFPDFVSLGENNSIGYKQDATHIIEWVFDADEEHRNNQLNPTWTHVCVRTAGTLVEFVFGKKG